jgi:hypothetical protein
MSTYKTIEEYNEHLIENQTIPTIINYVKEINKIKNNIDISFIDDFIELVNKNECCIHHNMLVKYKVVSLNRGTTDIKRLIEQYKLINDVDYQVRNVADLRPQGGTSIKNIYYFHPRAFKICLIRSLKTLQYADYYLLLEEAIKYFNDYQLELNKRYNIRLENKIIKQKEKLKDKKDKIDQLQLDVQELIKINKRMEKQNKKTETQLNEALEKLDITNYKLDETKEELDDTSEKLDLVAKKLDVATDDRVVKTKKLSILEYLVIMKNPNAKYKYYIIRGQKRYINKKKEELDGFTEIKSLECVPNANILWNLLKEKLKGNDFMGNRLNLTNINEKLFLELVEKVYNERKNVNI